MHNACVLSKLVSKPKNLVVMKKQQLKRLLDVITSGILIILLSPIIILTAIAIKLFSQGPILYHELRIGLSGNDFRYFKFRSMVPGTEEITKIGHFIRCWHFDELPEFFLVFIGRMSLVGPRAIKRETAINSNYSYYFSLPMKPGLTGLSQIRGGRFLEPVERAKIDLQYIQKWNLRNDFFILIKTPLAIISQRRKLIH